MARGSRAMLEGCTRIRQRRVGAWPPLRKACACWQGSFECPGGVGAHRGLGHDHVRGETVGNMVTSGRGRCLMRWRHPSQENQRMAQVGFPRWCSAWPRSLVDKTLAWRAPKGSADGAPPGSHPRSGLATCASTAKVSKRKPVSPGHETSLWSLFPSNP